MKKVVICALIVILLLTLSGSVIAESDLEVFQKIFQQYMEADYQRLPITKYTDPKDSEKTGMIWAGVLTEEAHGMYPWFARVRMEGEEISSESYARQYAITSAYFEQQGFLPCNKYDGTQEIILENLYLQISDTCDYRFAALKVAGDETGEYVNDELYILTRLRDEKVSKTWDFVAITDQEIVFAIVNSLVQNEDIRANIPNSMIEWLSRRPESGFMASVMIVEDNKDETAVALPTAYVRIQEKSDVNVRQKPDTESKRLGRAKAGKEYKWLSTTSNGWYEIQLDEDTTGYVSNKVTTLIEK